MKIGIYNSYYVNIGYAYWFFLFFLAWPMKDLNREAHNAVIDYGASSMSESSFKLILSQIYKGINRSLIFLLNWKMILFYFIYLYLNTSKHIYLFKIG